jgi:hypothetical protein
MSWPMPAEARTATTPAFHATAAAAMIARPTAYLERRTARSLKLILVPKAAM